MNILLTSAGRRSYIIDYFKNCDGIGKVFASNSEYSIALQRADDYLISPLIYSKEYIPAIIKFCKEEKIDVVISLFDIDLLVLAENRQIFEDNSIKLILAPVEFVRICNDKWLTYLFFKDEQIQTPKTYKTLQDIKDAIRNEEIKYPIIMKPRWGMASMEIYKVENEQELDVLTQRSLRNIFNSYLKFESNFTPNEAIIYQEIIEGEEYGLDVLNDLDGKYLATFAKQKVTMRSGETDLGRTSESSSFEKIAKRISSKSHHEGILSVDCFKNSNGIFAIEMNCRISGHYPLAYLAGFNYPQIITDWINNKTLNKNNLKFETGLYIVKDLVPTILRKENAS